MRRRAARLAFIAACALPGPGRAFAADTELSPSPAVQCLTRTEGSAARLEYPPQMFRRKDGGTVKVELVFTGPDRSPRVEVLDGSSGFRELVSAVSNHVRDYRVPCMVDGGPPVVLRQTFVFIPNDGRKVAEPVTQDTADAGRWRQLSCLVHGNGASKPEYPIVARQRNEQGNVLVRLTFTAADQPPQVEVLAAAGSSALRAAVEHHVADLRLPCLEQGPLVLTQLYKFQIDGSSRTLLKDATLLQFLASAEDGAQPVYFDTADMACPFEARLTYMRPYQPNRVLELETRVPARQPLLEWLSTLTLKLPPATNTEVLGQTIKLLVPCTIIDL